MSVANKRRPPTLGHKVKGKRQGAKSQYDLQAIPHNSNSLVYCCEAR